MKDNQSLWKAIAQARKEFTPVVFNKMGQVGHQKYPYADLKALYDATIPALQKHGVGIFQCLDRSRGESDIEIKTLIVHDDSGEEFFFFTPVPDQGVDPRKWGSAITYFKRYAYASFFCLHAEEDDDGATAARNPSASVKGRLIKMCQDNPKLASILLAERSIDSLSESEMNEGIKWLLGQGAKE